MKTIDALVESLPARAYDRTAPLVQFEAAATARVLDASLEKTDALLLEQQPGTAAAALLDWERNFNLPDFLTGGFDATEGTRRGNLLKRVDGRGNLSRAFMIDLAAAVGYPGCTITELGPMLCSDPCDGAVLGVDFVGAWNLNIPVSIAVIPMTAESPCDTALNSWGNGVLEGMIKRHKPANTVPLFIYAP